MKLIDMLEESDDVGAVHANFDVDADVLERIAAKPPVGLRAALRRFFAALATLGHFMRKTTTTHLCRARAGGRRRRLRQRSTAAPAS